MIYAKVIADSISPTGSRLTTVEAQLHRFILPELNTHRAFSRNSASSRAIPTAKLIEQVRTNPALPIEFGRNQPGMQASEVLDASDTKSAEIMWRRAAAHAANEAEKFAAMGVHKQVVNRLLEPFMWHKVIISSTEAGWENFLNQRMSPLAQPEINALAIAINDAMFDSFPKPVGYGEWHLPYITHADSIYVERRKVSASRCARVSYLTHDGVRDVSKDLDLYDKLISADPPHWSPMEHVATPSDDRQFVSVGNLDGWDQLRHLPECQ